jgi:CRISPR/Cas system-associated protein Cas10 (large subunit of type III CRISPR-Cas system)
MYERSARLDIALKRAFEETVRELYFGLEGVDSAEARRTLVRLKLGLLYMGGDDMLALMPSWLAPLVANSLAEKFRKHMGCARGISIGVAAGPSKAPVWSLIEAARELQQKAKDRARENPTNSFVCLDVSEVTLSRTSVEYRRSLLEKEKISRQPFLVGESNELLSALRSLFGPKSLYTCAYKVSRADETEEKKELKKIRALLREALTQARKLFSDPSSSPDLVIEVSRVYLIREMNRSKEEEKPIYERVLGFSELKNGHASYADAELLAKMLGGGII